MLFSLSNSFTCFIVSFLTIHVCCIIVNCAPTPDNNEDAVLTTPQLIDKYGYPQETHHIKTKDGYILEMHRIVARGKQPVLLMHGLLDSSATWVLSGPNNSLAYILADLGYDVWLGNARGNVYSRNHMQFLPTGNKFQRKKFWNFSWHEIGKFDLPAMIDYVLLKTKFKKLHYIGHSQGTTAFFVMTSEMPNYNEKVLFMAALAPPVYMSNVDHQLIRIFIKYLPSIQVASDFFGVYSYLDDTNELLKMAHNTLCSFNAFNYTSDLCEDSFSVVAGDLTNHINKTIIPTIKSHTPAGASTKQFFHFGQLIENNRFSKYNYGPLQNLQKYGNATPPDYLLENCKVPVALFYSDQDKLADSVDVIRLFKELPNVFSNWRVRDKTFNHIDFVWAMDAKELVYDYILEYMQYFENNRTMT